MRLFQLNDNCTHGAFRQLFHVRAIPRAELRLTCSYGLERRLPVGSGGLEFSSLHEDNDDVFIMKVHWNRFAHNPGVIPDRYSLVLEKFFRTFTGKSTGQAGFVLV